MDSFGYCAQLLLREIFIYRNRQLEEMDYKPCARCGKIPVLLALQRQLKNGRTVTYFDRTNRVDCDKTTGKKPMMETFHIECWLEELSFN